MKAFLPRGLCILVLILPLLSATTVPAVRVEDFGPRVRFQDTQFRHLQRGRALIAADFDLDDRVDFFVGNPGDESYILRNVDLGGGRFRFQIAQVLLVDELAWGAVSLDYDDDGDYDLFVTIGGNEGLGFNVLLRNLWLESGGTALRFVDVTDVAGVAGPIPPGETEPIAVANANAVAADYDRDGNVDVFVNVYILPESPPELLGRNILWRNNGDGTFADVTDAVGLGVTLRATQHSTFFDFDNDGDVDLYENNWENDPNDQPDGYNVLWRNRLVETGVADFEDVTLEFSDLPDEDLRFPVQSFDSAAADFNNDGWEDLIVFMKGAGPEPGSPYPEGHVLYINQGGTGFVNMAAESDLNNPFVSQQGVMGCQVGDVNGDGVPDVYIGNGSHEFGGGNYDQFFVADSPIGESIHFANFTHLINFRAPEAPGVIYPPYPYRTHGTVFADVDNDGTLEIAVVNGGPAAEPDEVREPDRLFKLFEADSPNYLKVRAVGDGISVSRDAIGTRFALTVSQGGGETWTVYRTLFGGSCFSAQNGFQVHFGLAQADTIQQLDITWPDGEVQTIEDDLDVNTSIVVER